MIKKVIIILWILLAVMLLACVLVFTSISKGWIGYMPPVEDLENPNYKFATQVFSADGKTLGTYSYSKENRVYVGYQDLSPHIINALIATEDVRFAEHSGIDVKALFRAVVKRGLLFQKNAGVVVPSPSSCPSSSIRPARRTRWNVSSRNPSSGSSPSSWNATTRRKRS